MEDLCKNKSESFKPLKIGQILKGRVVGRGRRQVFLDLGPGGTGIIFGQEFLRAKEILKTAEVDQEIFVKVVDEENEQGFWELSALEADRELNWMRLKEKKEAGENLTLKILSANKGGLLTQINGIPAFVPVSQLNAQHYPRVEDANSNRIWQELQKFVGQEMQLRILDLDPSQEKLILSEKLQESERVKEILKNYQVGDVVEGEITGIVDFGAFVKFPTAPPEGNEWLEGLIHISELDWQLIENPADVVKVGEKHQMKIIDLQDGKVSLSLRALREDPWQSLSDEEFQKGKIVSGRVTKLNPFGAFVQVLPKVQGLCHISEFRSRAKMEETLQIGQEYRFEILLLDRPEHRLLLKLLIEHSASPEDKAA